MPSSSQPNLTASLASQNADPNSEYNKNNDNKEVNGSLSNELLKGFSFVDMPAEEIEIQEMFQKHNKSINKIAE